MTLANSQSGTLYMGVDNNGHRGFLSTAPVSVQRHGFLLPAYGESGWRWQALPVAAEIVPTTPAERMRGNGVLAGSKSTPHSIKGDSLSPVAPYRIVNSDKMQLLAFVKAIEDCLGQKAIRNDMDMKPGDVPATWAYASLLQRLMGYKPQDRLQRRGRAVYGVALRIPLPPTMAVLVAQAEAV